MASVMECFPRYKPKAEQPSAQKVFLLICFFAHKKAYGYLKGVLTMDRVDLVLMFAMLCLIGGTLLVGFSRPLWWMFHQRRPDGGRDTPRRYEWYLRLPGFALLAVAACVIFLSVTNSMVFR
jgi:hypothetical protein